MNEDTQNYPLSTQEAALYLKVSVNQLMLWRKNGQAPKCYQRKEGGKLYFFKKDLDNWIKQNDD